MSGISREYARSNKPRHLNRRNPLSARLPKIFGDSPGVVKLHRSRKAFERIEWDFSGLPKEEQFACCFHEYLRETGAAGKEDKPWKTISPKRRKVLAKRYSAFVKRGNTFSPGEDDIQDILSAKRPRAFFVNKDGVLQIRWRGYTDAEIISSCRRWLKEHRPKGTRAKGSGQKHVDHIVALERLAITRLLHRYTPKEIDALPESAQIKREVFRGRDIFKGRKAALKFFNKFFPGNPRSFKTASQQKK